MTETVKVVSESRMLIGGKLVEADSGKTFDNTNPATEEVLGQVTDGTTAERTSSTGEPHQSQRAATAQPHGGQLSGGRTHGYGYVHEAVTQLRGHAGARQVANAEVAVVSTGGGVDSCLVFTR